MLEGPGYETPGRIPDAGEVGAGDRRDVLPDDTAQIGGVEIGVGQVHLVEVGRTQVGAGEIAVAQVRVVETACSRFALRRLV